MPRVQLQEESAFSREQLVIRTQVSLNTLWLLVD
eukprot:CAMPEP_0119065134 /NCGR_PEP_ID=MMETSP1178-20130426/8032_1 /TAXON_ID=33656 /ORGANISM="unid sp, Strain CCMP2000" /LENGTH=33 /DNA_ID=CAMNT_0007046627 /DNA_START=331 /DNA_END=432 /DNA_ORIENTATION=+